VEGRRGGGGWRGEDLGGYGGAGGVGIGRGATAQKRTAVSGAVLASTPPPPRHSERLPRRLWPIVQAQAECATQVWQNPDQGIWEARGKPQHYVSSKLMCWGALDRAAKIAEIRGDPAVRDQGQAAAEAVPAHL